MNDNNKDYIVCGRFNERLEGTTTFDDCLTAGVELLSEIFQLSADEIAVFTIREQLGVEVLKFLYPRHLAAAASGYISLKSDSSLAVRTYLDKQAYMNLLFSSTPHSSYFEMIPADRSSGRRSPPIQQIMSVPLCKIGGFKGVLQVSRKGDSPELTNPSFAEGNLTLLTQLAGLWAENLTLKERQQS